ncbi:spermidine synthase [Ancylobacter sp. TS-1]|uniref:spermidine synthase n=1 Tax=Ancylobacter sp. TS-1 TaxID=1850374 RepID=UPI00192E4138|nr:spermidine synthase [Ancylobacter sp. TS-1]
MFEELDFQVTSLGTLVLRRRRDLSTGQDIFEIKLNDDFLMSSKFTVSEEALSRLGLAELSETDISVVVGGLGLGYTAASVLQDRRVRSMLVVDALKPVIDWHEGGLLPLGQILVQDKRCRLIHGNFFEMAGSPATGFDPVSPGRRFDAILLDIDHSPTELLHPSNAALYTFDGLTTLARHLRPQGVFALWSNNREDPAFMELLRATFGVARAEPVVFDNPLQGREAHQCVYIARNVEGDE